MTLIEAVKARHSVRKYIDRPLPEAILKELEETVAQVNREGHLHIQLVTREPRGFGGRMAYGTFSGVSSYFVAAGPKSGDLEEKIGYYGEKLVLKAQQLGLNTCWAGLTYNKIPGTYELDDNEKIVCYIALGYGQTQGTERSHKKLEELSNVSDATPQWFRTGVEAAQLAPTAVNQQKFFIEYLGTDGTSGKPQVSIRSRFSMVGYTKTDLGIVRLHFEIGAGTDNFEWVK